MSARPFRVLVLCTGNSARSQIGEALLLTRGRERGAGAIDAASAGSRPVARVNPFAVEALARHGIAWEDRHPQSVDAVTGDVDLAITVCDNARDACPVFPGARAQAHWGLPDPAEETEPGRARAAFEATYRALDERVAKLLALPLEHLDPAELAAHAREIHARAEHRG